MRRRTFLLRMNDPFRKKMRQKRKGTKAIPALSSMNAASRRAQRGEVHDHKGPEFLIAFRGQMRVMRLMDGAIKREAHKTQRSSDNTIQFVQQSILAQQSVRGLMKPNQRTVHKMTDEQHEGRRQPDPAAKNSEAKRNLRDQQGGHN